MTEPLNDVDLSKLDAIEAPREDKEPFLHSVTKQTPWCLYSVMFHVLVVALVGMAPLLVESASDREEVLVLIDPGPRTESEFYSSSTRAVPIDEPLPCDRSPGGPVDVLPNMDGPAPDLFEPSDHIMSTDPSENSNGPPAPLDAFKDARLARQAVELTEADDAAPKQPHSIPNSPTRSFKDCIQSYLSKLWFLRARDRSK